VTQEHLATQQKAVLMKLILFFFLAIQLAQASPCSSSALSAIQTIGQSLVNGLPSRARLATTQIVTIANSCDDADVKAEAVWVLGLGFGNLPSVARDSINGIVSVVRHSPHPFVKSAATTTLAGCNGHQYPSVHRACMNALVEVASCQ
jgi:hypothetical protein